MTVSGNDPMSIPAVTEYAQKHLRRLRVNLARTLQSGEVEAVHDLRVASRRLQEPIGLIADDVDGRRAKSVLRTLKETRRTFRNIRDLDVIPSSLGSTAESGMDMAMGDDPYDSFKKYQTLLIREYNTLAEEFGFQTVNARLRPGRIQAELRSIVSEAFAQRHLFGSLDRQESPAAHISGPIPERKVSVM